MIPSKITPVLSPRKGKLFFHDGVLVRIIREVSPSSIDTDRDLAFSLYGIVQGLEKEDSNHLCSVNTTEEMSEPGIEIKEILLTCSVGTGVTIRAVVVTIVLPLYPGMIG
jgi:hypothetical protein